MATPNQAARHRTRHRSRARLRARSLLMTASAVAAAVVAAVVLSGGTYALWSAKSTVPAVTITAGSLAISATATFDQDLWGNLLVGEKVRQPFTVTNTGTTAVRLSATATAGDSALEVRLASGDCPSTALPGTIVGTVPRTLDVLAAGSRATVCLEVGLGAAATAGSSVDFRVALTGTQLE